MKYNIPVNSDCTLYHKKHNNEAKTQEYKRYYLPSVLWTGGKGSSLKKGLEKSNDVSIRIWHELNEPFEVEIGDLIIQGKVEDTISKESDLSNYEALRIMSKAHVTFNNVPENTSLGAK